MHWSHYPGKLRKYVQICRVWTSCLARRFLAKEFILAWERGTPRGAALRQLCSLEENALQVVSTMLRKMPGRLAGATPEVVAALVAKLAAAQSSPLITSLLIVLAQLVHSDARQLLDFLASHVAPGVRPSASVPSPVCHAHCFCTCIHIKRSKLSELALFSLSVTCRADTANCMPQSL